MIGKLAIILLAGTAAARADVMISNKATANMSCSAGVCSPTAAKAVLNTTDLANMLAGGDVKVTTGSGATNIVVKDGFSWTATSRLTLDAIQSVEFDKPVTVAGTGAVTITTNDGGSGGDLLFADKVNLTFWDLSSSLIINGKSYTLVGDIKTLATDIAANPSGFYAFANDYDASVDGTYASSPVSAELDGTFEGLGHRIDALTISASGANLGLFAITRGTLRDVQITRGSITGDTDNAGMLVADALHATIANCSASGTITLSGTSEGGGLVSGGSGSLTRSHANVAIHITGTAIAGGLVGGSDFNIFNTYATGNISGDDGSRVGGLVGELGVGVGGTIGQSYATGKVSGGEHSRVGGLFATGGAPDQIDNSYATGAVVGSATAIVGGFAGEIVGTSIHSSYSIGHVGGGATGHAGGFIGQTDGGDSLGANYFDTQTSGQSDACGNGCDGQVKGKRTGQLQAGLPGGFDPSIWGEKKKIDGGLPYLKALPPPQ